MDIARENRLKKFDEFLEEIGNIARSKRLKKIRDRYNTEEVGKLCTNCLQDIEYLFNKTNYVL